jgi:hypothetical protein
LSNIRVTYSGLIGLLISSITMIIGMIFVLITTRELTEIELGTWALIGSLMSYVIIIEPIISYWTVRETARGIESQKTAIFSSLGFSIVGTVIYLIIIFLVGNQTNIEINYLYFASILIPLTFINRTLTAINLGWKPQAESYSILGLDLAKTSAAILLVYILQLGLEGVIISLFIAQIVSIGILFSNAKEKILGKIKKEHLKKWIKFSWVPVYTKFSTLIVFDVLIFTIIVDSVVGIAYWSVSMVIANLSRITNQLSRVVYPKLLEGGKKEHLQENLVRTMYFLLPICAISITFARPGLFALNPIYEHIWMIVIFLTIKAFLRIIGKSFSQGIEGIEKVDFNENSTFLNYAKSSLFKIPTIRLIQRIIYLSSLTIILIFMKDSGSSELELVVYWSAIVMVVEIPFTITFLLMVRKKFPFNVDWKSISKYLMSAIVVFTGIHLLMEQFLVYNETIFEFLPQMIIFLVIGGLAYLGLTYTIDKRTRVLILKIVKEFRK